MKKMTKASIIGLALVFTMGASISAMALNSNGRNIKDLTAKVMADRGTMLKGVGPGGCLGKGDKRAVLTDAQKAEMKKASDEHFRKILDYYTGTGAVTQADADAAYKLVSESTDRIDGTKLPTSVQDALKDLAENGKSLTTTQRDALAKGMATAVKAELQKLVDSKALPSDFPVDPATHERGSAVTLTDAQREAMRAACEKAEASVIADLVKAGTLTKTQGDKLLLGLGGKGFGPGRMGHGMGHGMGPGHGGKGGAQRAPVNGNVMGFGL